METTKMGTTKMGTTKMGTTKKSAIKPNKRFLGAGTKRMTNRSLQNSKSGSRLFYQIALTRTAELKKKVIAVMTKPSLRTSKSGSRLFYYIVLTRTAEPKKKVIEAMAPKPEPIMEAPRRAELVLGLLGTTVLPDPNKSVSLALKALITEVDDFLLLVLMCKPELLKCCNDMVLSNANLDRSI